MTKIHPSAVVDAGAELGVDVEIGPGAVVGPEVKIGDRSIIGAYVVLEGRLTMGADNRVYPHAVLGTPPQDLKYENEPTCLEIGDRNLIREFVTVHRGTPQGKAVTRIGSDVFLMAYTHVSHDNLVADHVVIANNVQISGHVTIGTHVIVGGCSAIHQFVRIGPHAFIGGGTLIHMDVLPFCRAAGTRARLHGLNYIGLKRRGFSGQDLKALRKAYRLILQSDLLVEEAASRIDVELVPHCAHASELVEFLRTSRRGITR